MSATSVHRPPVFPHLWLLWFAGAHVLLAALSQGDPAQITYDAHKLKGTAMLMGFRALVKSSAQLEQWAAQSDQLVAAGCNAIGTEQARRAVEAEDFEGAMSAIARLRAPVDAFFEAVMVNAEDAKVRANRYALLSRLRGLFLGVADISLLG